MQDRLENRKSFDLKEEIRLSKTLKQKTQDMKHDVSNKW